MPDDHEPVARPAPAVGSTAATDHEPGAGSTPAVASSAIDHEPDTFFNFHTIVCGPGMDGVATELIKWNHANGNPDLDVRMLSCENLTRQQMLEQEFHKKGVVAWGSFPSGDPDIKLCIDAIRDKHVVFIMNCEDSESLFRQLNLAVYLQRFLVPKPDKLLADGKWKTCTPSMQAQGRRDGNLKPEDELYDVCHVASLTIIVPWVRSCQMERTCRWTIDSTKSLTTDKWDNSKPDGEFVDVPTLSTFAAMLSATPCDDSFAIARRCLFIDIHEYADLEISLNASMQWSNVATGYLCAPPAIVPGA